MKSDSYKSVKIVLWIILVANLIVAFLKVAVGFFINSTSIMADGFHSISDASSNVVGLVGINLASKPVDKQHPYGHHKFEIITGMFIGSMLLFMGCKIVIEAMNRFINPVDLIITNESLLLIFTTLIINIFVSKYEFKKGKKLNSYILISDSLHTRSDIFVSIGVIIALICIKLGIPTVIDPIVSMGVSVCIFHSAYEIFKSAIDILVDSAVIEEEVIVDILKNIDGVKDVHNVRSRGCENNIYLDMHIMVDPSTTVDKSHKLEHEIESLIKCHINENTQVIIHIEPFYNNKY
ncbi:MAG: cation diffusion facilitator family transporter [Paraclostridium sp.]|uniref:cation diffusion facilitator family transporter n=1 Tax=Paraclostridium sp. TaxID=2023273 RepID=UPI003AA79BC9